MGESKNPNDVEVGVVEEEEQKPAKPTKASPGGKVKHKSGSPRLRNNNVACQKENKRPGNRTKNSPPTMANTRKPTKSVLKDLNAPLKPIVTNRSSVPQTSNVKKSQASLEHTSSKPLMQIGCGSVMANDENQSSSHDESDLEIIEVKAIDKVVKVESSEDTSDEADDIVSQVLGEERRQIEHTVEK